MRDADLRAVFDRSVRRLARGVPIRKTIAGIWTPSPVSVIVQVAALLREMGLVGAAAAPGPVVDAGTGDGRVAAVLSRLEPSRPVYGIEKDPALCVQAAANLRALRARGEVHLVEGDYCDVAAYESCGLDRRAIAVVVNYPDGNQRRLARFVAAHAGPDARLCLFTHDRSVEVDELVLQARRDAPVDDGPDWRLSVYAARGVAPRGDESGEALRRGCVPARRSHRLVAPSGLRPTGFVGDHCGVAACSRR